MAQILKMLHLAQQHGMAQMQIGSGGIEACLDAQRPAGLGVLLRARVQILFADDLGEALFQVRRVVQGTGCTLYIVKWEQ